MGNQQKSNFTLDNIIDELEKQSILNSPNIGAINDILIELKNMFIKDPQFYLNYKSIEKEMKKLKDSDLNKANKDNENGEASNLERKTLKFLKLLTKIPILVINQKNTNEFNDLIENFLEIINLIKDDRAVLDFFYYNSLEFFIDIIVNEHNLSQSKLSEHTKIKISK